MKAEMRKRIILFILHASSFFCLVFLSPPGAFAQSVSKITDQKKEWELNSPTKYYRVTGLGIDPSDSINKFPHPTATIRVLDSKHTKVVVRFPELGLLGVQEDTVTAPTSTTGDTLWEYKSRNPLYILNFPKTEYFLFIDVWSNDGKKLLDSRPFEFDMNAEAYRSIHLEYKHAPTTGMGSLTLRRKFQPTLLPLSIETNPGWSAMETLDSTMTYALTFHDPTQPGKLELSLTMRPASVGVIDSAMWKHFKMKAEMAFGAHGVATSSIGDFQVIDSASRRIIKAGYEFISKNVDSTLDYIAAYLTPRAILLLLAPIDAPNQQLEVQYFEAIARSISEP
jgi:hypothetical protein